MNISPPWPHETHEPVPSPGGLRRPRRMSEVLAELATREDDRIRLADLLTAVGDRAFGAIMVVLAAPNIIPLPPGSSAIFALPLILVTAQLAVGRRVLWLPRVLSERALPRVAFADIVRRLMPYLLRVERVLAPRFQFLFGPIGDRVIGGTCLLMALVLFLPIPFGNFPPAIAMAAFGLALLERDGVFVMIGALASIASGFVLLAIGGAMVAAGKAFFTTLFGI